MRALHVLAFLLAGTAQAATLDLGNVAPGSGEVRFAFGNSAGNASLGYLDFARTEREPGPLEVTAFGADDRVLAQRTLDFQPRAGIDPMLVLVGNGRPESPFELRLETGADAGTLAQFNYAIFLHHFAPIASLAAMNDFQAALNCIARSREHSGQSSFGAIVSRYDQSRPALYSGNVDMNCAFKTAHRVFGNFDFDTAMSPGTIRFMLVGDADHEPVRVVVVKDGVVQNIATEATPSVGSVLKSTAFWFDVARPAQGVTLYEMPGADASFGTLFTHDDAGQPTWFFLDGVATPVRGQRTLTVYRPGRNGEVTRLDPAGTATLFYIDCNQAELRVLMGRDYVTMRLRRSRELVSCDALD